MLIFGSTALRYWFSDFSREPHDLDIICNQTSPSIGVDVLWFDGIELLFEENKDLKYVDPDILFTIKLSHLSWDVNWDKHMHDFIFLKNKGCQINEKLYKLFYEHWNKHYSDKSRIKLKVKNEDFFTNRVKRKYEHDYLHEVFAFKDRPMNEKIRPDLSSPYCSFEMWESLTHEEKIKCCLEESYVIGFERFVLNGKHPMSSKTLGLKYLITSLSKGWFNRFLIMNFEELVKFDPTHYKEKLKKLEF